MTLPPDRRRTGVGADLSTWALAAPLALLPGRPAAAVLRKLAYRVGLLDDATPAHPYARITMIQTATDIQTIGTTTAITLVTTRTRWRNELTNSGQVTGTRWHQATTTPGQHVTVHYRSPTLPGILPGPIPTVAHELNSALDRAPHLPPADTPITTMRGVLTLLGVEPPTGATARVRAVGDLVRWHDTPPAVRESTLLSLTTVPNVLTHGLVRVAGHPTVAISVTTGATRDVLLVDATTGDVRAVELVLLDERIGRALGVMVPYCLARTRITGRGRSAHPGDTT